MKGCGNHGCRVEKPIGMATNGPCKCPKQSAWVQLLLRTIQGHPDYGRGKGKPIKIIRKVEIGK